jgi:hypothetical protein
MDNKWTAYDVAEIRNAEYSLNYMLGVRHKVDKVILLKNNCFGIQRSEDGCFKARPTL